MWVARASHWLLLVNISSAVIASRPVDADYNGKICIAALLNLLATGFAFEKTNIIIIDCRYYKYNSALF